MTETTKLLLTELRSIPEPLQRQVLNFLLFRKARGEAREAGDREDRFASGPSRTAPPHGRAYIRSPSPSPRRDILAGRLGFGGRRRGLAGVVEL